MTEIVRPDSSKIQLSDHIPCHPDEPMYIGLDQTRFYVSKIEWFINNVVGVLQVITLKKEGRA